MKYQKDIYLHIFKIKMKLQLISINQNGNNYQVYQDAGNRQ